jgi:hypothetical protein
MPMHAIIDRIVLRLGGGDKVTGESIYYDELPADIRMKFKELERAGKLTDQFIESFLRGATGGYQSLENASQYDQANRSVRLLFTATRSERSTRSKSTLSKTSLRKPLLPSRTPACATSCASRCNSRQPPPTCSSSSAVRRSVSKPYSNPWTKAHWQLTSQARIIMRDRAEADRLARAAGHKDAMSSRLKTAK